MDSKENFLCSHQKTDVQWPDGVVDSVKVAGKKRNLICDLKPGVIGGAIVGIIISKQDAKSFADRRDTSQMRWQLKFTLRDSPTYFINVCCWGGEAYINAIARSFRIGDVVELENVLVQSKLHTESEQKYNPSTPSPYSIVMNEKYAVLKHYKLDNFDQFHSISFLPVKENSDYYTLGDIVANAETLRGSHVNILAVVRDPGCRKDIMTKTGRRMLRHEVSIFDESCMSFPLVIWDNERSELANRWRCKEAVLFIADVKLHFDDFRNCMMATCDPKSIITVNPDIPEAHDLYAYAQSVDITMSMMSNGTSDAAFEIERIQDVFTLSQLQQKLCKSRGLDASSCFYGIVYACFTHFDLDCFNAADKLVINTCLSCKRRLHMDGTGSNRLHCIACHEYVETSNKDLNIPVELSDFTGGFGNLTLRGAWMEKIIGSTMDNFRTLSVFDRTDIKWKFLLERYKVFFKCYTGRPGNDPHVVILHAEQFERADVAKYLNVLSVNA